MRITMDCKKHAYLIMAYNNMEVVKVNLKLIDDRRNDIYIHLDSKCNCMEKLEELIKNVKNSKVYLIKRNDNRWGDYSLVETEIALLRESTQNYEYQYYHLISESD